MTDPMQRLAAAVEKANGYLDSEGWESIAAELREAFDEVKGPGEKPGASRQHQRDRRPEIRFRREKTPSGKPVTYIEAVEPEEKPRRTEAELDAFIDMVRRA